MVRHAAIAGLPKGFLQDTEIKWISFKSMATFGATRLEPHAYLNLTTRTRDQVDELT
jgi:hypothetical protein